MTRKQQNSHPFGGWFGTLGGFIGMAVGFDLAQLPGLVIGLIGGALLGLMVEHVLYRLLLFACAILYLMARHELFHAIFQ